MSNRGDADCGPTAVGTPPSEAFPPRRWGQGWRGYVFPGLWLIYLGQTLGGVHQHSSGVGVVIGDAIIVLFAACYLRALPMGWTGARGLFWVLYGASIALMLIETLFAQDDAFVFAVYISVLTVAARQRWSAAAVAAMAVLIGFAPMAVPSWHQGFDYQGVLAVLLVSLAMFGFFSIVRSNIELAAARAEVARLAAENERSRIARDLHDLLGHSLTTITVKAGLARRLAERGEEARALTEITEVEQLSRRTLGDVRAAVSRHREVTLAGELATAREVLRAAAITAELPGSVDVVDPRYSELFGWAVREGITNIVRHSRADHCTVALTPNTLIISDDGRGAVGGSDAGNGLTGLRERVEAAGGTISANGTMGGWELLIEMPTDAVSPSAAAEPAPASAT